MVGELVLLVEDHPLTRSSAALILQSANFEVHAAATALEGASLAAEYAFDVALVDLDLPDRPGLWLIRSLAAAYPRTAIAALTASIEADRVVAVLDAGAHGYISKLVEPDDLPKKVALLAAGEEAFDEAISARLIRALRGDVRRIGKLTLREVEVLQLLAAGADTVEMAKLLFLSPNSVKDHVRTIYRKLNVHDRAAAVAMGFRLGYIT